MAQTLPARFCTECGNTLEGKAKFTCSPKCRVARSRRQRNSNVPSEVLEEVHQGSLVDEAREVMREELRPVVREAITSEIYDAVGKMVGLTTKAVALIAADMESDDPLIRQRAYTLLMKYTVGQPGIGPKDEGGTGAGLVVNIGLPGPDAEPVVADIEAHEITTGGQCDTCLRDVDEFVAQSRRCPTCFAAQQSQAQEYLLTR